MRLALLIATLAVPAAFPAVLSIKVVDSRTGAALRDAEAWLISPNRPAEKYRASEAGTFQTADLANGESRLSIWKPGHLFTELVVQVDTGRLFPNPIVVRLVPLGAVDGKVTGLQGRSAKAFALLQTAQEDPKLALGSFLRGSVRELGATVNADGTFRIQDLPPGRYAFAVAYENVGDLSGGVVNPERPVSLDLEPGATIHPEIAISAITGYRLDGTVTLPASGAWFWVSVLNPKQPSIAVATTSTRPDGTFAFRGIPSGSYDLLMTQGVGQPGNHSKGTPVGMVRLFSRLHVDLADRDLTAISIQPQPAARSSIALRSVGGACNFPVPITTTSLEDGGDSFESTQNILNKREPIPEPVYNLAPAKYAVSLHTSACQTEGKTTLDGGGSAVETSVVAGSGSLRGSLKTATSNAADWQVTAIPIAFSPGWPYLPGILQWSVIRTSLVSSNGRFGFSDLPVGRYRVEITPVGESVSGSAANWQTMPQFEVKPRHILEIELNAPN